MKIEEKDIAKVESVRLKGRFGKKKSEQKESKPNPCYGRSDLHWKKVCSEIKKKKKCFSCGRLGHKKNYYKSKPGRNRKCANTVKVIFHIRKAKGSQNNCTNE